jgi:hypothetical protein
MGFAILIDVKMQGTTMRRPSMFGGVTAMAGIVALIVGLAVIDERVRMQFSLIFSGRPPTGEIASLGHQVEDLFRVLWQGIADQSVENAPLVVFSVAALVLVVWMTRT